MKAFRVWVREHGYLIEGVEWSNGIVFARRLEWPDAQSWEFPTMGKCRDYIHAAFGPDAHVVVSDAGELRFSAPGLLPRRPSETGDDTVPPPMIAQPESPDVLEHPKGTRKQTVLRTVR